MTFIIAEISGNHGGDLHKAQELIWWAAKSGCDAVKFQFYKPEDLGGEYDPQSNFPVPEDWLDDLFSTAYRAGVPLFASVFAPWAIEVLRDFSPFAYKLASPESTRLQPHIYRALALAVTHEFAKLFVSTGLDDLEMMRGLHPDILFYCKAGYPAVIDERDIQLMDMMRGGFSDHTAGIISTLAMIHAGATHIEKHFKVDECCIDSEFSLNPAQMKLLCEKA